MQIKLTKHGVDSSFSGSEKFFKTGRKKSNTLQKIFFFLIIFTNQNITVFGQKKLKKKIMEDDQYLEKNN